jgi:hypothetical protein
MGYSDDEVNEAIRLSWCHLTPGVEWEGCGGTDPDVEVKPRLSKID